MLGSWLVGRGGGIEAEVLRAFYSWAKFNLCSIPLCERR